MALTSPIILKSFYPQPNDNTPANKSESDKWLFACLKNKTIAHLDLENYFYHNPILNLEINHNSIIN